MTAVMANKTLIINNIPDLAWIPGAAEKLLSSGVGIGVAIGAFLVTMNINQFGLLFYLNLANKLCKVVNVNV